MDQPKRRNPVRMLLWAILLLSMLNLGWVLVTSPMARQVLSPDHWRNVATYSDVMRLIHTEYVDSDRAAYDQLTSEAIGRMVESLDPYSTHWTQEEYQSFEQETRQRYVGVGVEIQRLNRRVTITGVFEGSPAEEAGLRPGDQIVAVDGEDTREYGLSETVELVRGPAGSRVTLTLHRPREGQTITREVRRGAIAINSIRDIAMLDDQIGYLHIRQFGDRTANEFREALTELEGEGIRALVIDVRDNPGGTLRSTRDLLDYFFDEGELIVSIKSRATGRVSKYVGLRDPIVEELPVAVLINGGSASASEILAGALQDTGRAVVVGEQSFGKGSVQSIFEMANGEAVKITTSLYYLPNGETIDNVGIEPDIVVKLNRSERFKLLVQRQHSQRLGPRQFVERFGFEPIEDRQLQSATDALRAALAFATPASGS